MAKFDRCNIPDGHAPDAPRSTAPFGANQYGGNLFGRGEFTHRAHHIAPLALDDIAPWHRGISRLQGVDNLQHSQAIASKPFRVYNNAKFPLAAAVDIHPRHTRHALQPVADKIIHFIIMGMDRLFVIRQSIDDEPTDRVIV